MQTFNLINAQDRVKKSRATINANFEAVASNFSGIAFPTVNLYVGMKCYRTDLNQTFTLNNVELQTWVDDSDIADKAITTEKLADQSVTKEKIAPSAITTEKITNGAVTKDKIAPGVLTASNVGAYDKAATYNRDEINKSFRKIGDKVVEGNIDWNTLTEPTTYKIQGAIMNDAHHAPPNEYNFGILVVHRLIDGADHESRTVQVYYPHATRGYWSRMLNGTGWTAWSYIPTHVELNTVAEQKASTRVNKSGDTMIGDLKFVESDNTHGSIFPSHYFHNLYGNTNTIYIHAFPSHPAVAKKTKFEFRTADGTSNSWTAHKLNSDGFTTPTLIFSSGGYIGDSKRDVGDAITDNGGANVNIGSWFGLGFYSTYSKKYTGAMDLRNGNWRTLGRIIAHEGFHARGDIGIVFSDRGGGWFMSDSTWIRAYGDKNIFTPGKMKADGGFEGKATSAGRADSSVVSDRAVRVENDHKNMRFHWDGQGGQPSWLWGGNDGENMYVYNPSNFTVSRANTAGRADTADNATNAINATNATKARQIDGNVLVFSNGTKIWVE